MPRIKPFRAVRPSPCCAGDVIIAHSDNKDTEIAAKAAAENPYSFLHICRADIDKQAGERTDDGAAAQSCARAAFADFRRRGILYKDDYNSLYIYRMSSHGHSQTGIIACVHIDDYLEGRVKRHELTKVEKTERQVRVIETCGADIEPVVLVYKDEERIRSLTEGYASLDKPFYDLTDKDGTRHELWVVSDHKFIESLTSDFSGMDSLYIADGHHRVAASSEVGKRDPRGEKLWFMAAMFPDDEMNIYDYNRTVSDIGGMSDEEFVRAIRAQGFDVRRTGCAGSDELMPVSKGEFNMLLGKEWYRLVYAGALPENDVVASIDTAILQDHLLRPVLGIEDPRKDARLNFVSGDKGMRGLADAVAGGAKAAFAVSAVTIGEIMHVADAGKTMPPKSTWFDPKPVSGLTIHEK